MRNLVLALSAALALVIGQQSFANVSEEIVKLTLDTDAGKAALQAEGVTGATASDILKSLSSLNAGKRQVIEAAMVKLSTEVNQGLDKNLAANGVFKNSDGSVKTFNQLKAVAMTAQAAHTPTATAATPAAAPNACSTDNSLNDFAQGLTSSEASEMRATIDQERAERPDHKISYSEGDCENGLSKYVIAAKRNYLKIREFAAKAHSWTRATYKKALLAIGIATSDTQADQMMDQFGPKGCNILVPAGA